MDTIESTRKRVGTTLFPFDTLGFAYRQRLRRDLQLIDEHARAIADGVIVPESYCLLQALFREMDRAGLERDPVLARPGCVAANRTAAATSCVSAGTITVKSGSARVTARSSRTSASGRARRTTVPRASPPP